MKTWSAFKTIIALIPLMVPSLVNANSITLTAADASGSSSFNTAGHWSDGNAPASTNDYYISTFGMRTPGDANNYTFGGNSLTLLPPAAGSYSIIYKGSAANIYTINNFTNSGGFIRSGSSSVQTMTIAGNMMFMASNSTMSADQSPYIIASPVFGTAIMTNANPANQTFGTVTYSGTNSGFTGEFFQSGNAIVIFGNASSTPGNPATANPGQITLSGGSQLRDTAGINYNNANGGITLLGNATITASAPGNTTTTIASAITDNGANYVVTKAGGGILTLSGSNTFGGGLSLTVPTLGSQLNINSSNALGTGTFTVASSTIGAAVLDNTSGSTITASNSNIWNNSFGLIFLGSSSLDLGANGVGLQTNMIVTVSNNNLTVGPVAGNGTGLSLTKSGPGTLTLTAANTYTGATVVSNGVLALTGSATLSSSNISLASGTLNVTGVGGLTLASGQTLGGSGTVVGTVISGGGTTVSPGGNAMIGTLTVNGNLNLNGSALNFDLTANPTPGSGLNDLVIITGTLNLSGLTSFNISGTPVNGSEYTLFQYGTLSGSVANLSIPGFIITNNTAINAIQITPAHVPQNLTWHGDGSANVWDNGITANWIDGGTNQVFIATDFVTFDNTGSATPAVNLTGSISPGSVTVNSTQTYDFTGSPILSGNLTKSGSGTLILENGLNTYGTTAINGGILQIGNNNGSGNPGTGGVTNNATLAFDLTNAITVTNAISGTGVVVQSGTGGLTLSGSNSYAGLTMISATGVLYPGSSNALGAATAGLINTNGGNFYVNQNFNFPNEPLTLGSVNGSTALEKGGGGVSYLGGPVTFVSATTLSVDGGATLNLTNASGLNGAGDNINLTLAGSGAGNISGPLNIGLGNLTVNGGAWTIAPANNFSGTPVINGGALLLTGPLSLGPVPGSFNASAVTLNGGSLGAATNVTLADGNIGITISDNFTTSGFTVVSNATFTVSNNITGDASSVLTKSGVGTLVLAGPNTFAGTLNIDTSSTSANDGTTLIADTAAIANMLAISGVPFIYIRDNNGGSSTLGLNGTLGSVTIAPDISLNGRNVAVPAIENLAGNNTVSGDITFNVGGGFYIFQSDSGTLTFSSASPMPVSTPTSSGRGFTFQGNGNITVSAVIQDGSNNGASNVWNNVIKSGTGTLNLTAANTFSGGTMVNAGVLALTGSLSSGVSVAGGLLVGNGSIGGAVTVVPGGSIEAGSTNALGTLTLANTLALSGNTVVKLSGPGVSDLFSGQTAVTYGGTLTVTNLGSALALGNTFTLFSASTATGNFASIIGSPGAGLRYSFTNGVLSVVQGPPGTPTNIVFSVSGGTMSLSWPANYLGWILQAQTNTLSSGLGTNWVDVAGTGSVTSTNMPVNSANGAVFYRLRYPN